jgi:hypothetical protein
MLLAGEVESENWTVYVGPIFEFEPAMMVRNVGEVANYRSP